MALVELPFPLAGRIFKSPMPFSSYDPEGDVLLRFEQERISLVVLLAEEEECLRRTGRNLKEFYVQEGFRVIHLPTPDFYVPPKEELEEAARITVEEARRGSNIVIHCHAGIGRTGLFAAYLAKKVLGVSGEEAIQWVRRYIPGAVETREQRRLITDEEPE